MTVYLGKIPVGIGRIVEKKVAKKKFGATADAFLGDVDANGVLSAPTEQVDLVFDGVREIGSKGLYYTFYGSTNISSVDLSSLQTVGIQGLYYAFNGSTNISSVDLSSLQTVEGQGLYFAFNGCTNLTNVDLSSLTTVGSNGLYYAFNGCTNLTNVDLSSLTTVGSNGLYYAFYTCTNLTNVDLSSLVSVDGYGLGGSFSGAKLTTISFPSLTDVQTTSFGSSTTNNAFWGCATLTEIHFRADMQATIEAMSQYANKWGATNATIYFDL